MRCKAPLLVCSALATLSTTVAHAAPIWKGDFEPGDLSQWTEFERVSSGRLTVESTTVPPGAKYAMKTLVQSGDIVFNGARAEVDYEEDRPQEGDDRYYRWQTMFPNDFQSADLWQIFTQWHQYVAGGSPPLAFMAWGENIQLGNNLNHYYWTAPLVRGVWHDFIVHVKWSKNESVGGVEIWYDGEHVLPFSHGVTLFANDTVYLKQGLYRQMSIQQDQIIYHAGMTVGKTFDDVSPPPPPPAPVATTPAAPSAPSTPSNSVLTTGNSATSTANSTATTGIAIKKKAGCNAFGTSSVLSAAVAAAWLARRRRWRLAPSASK